MVAADQSGQHQGRVNPTWILSSATHVSPIGYQANSSISGWNKVRIVALEHALAGEAEVYDANGCLACPGLIETHIHLDKSRIIDRCAPQERKTLSPVKGVSPLKESMSVEDVHARAERTLQDCIKHGATRMRTQVEVDPAIGMRGFEGVQSLIRGGLAIVWIEIGEQVFDRGDVLLRRLLGHRALGWVD